MAADDIRITPDRFDALLFDLDGVLTKTATVHAEAWKEAFDEFLAARAESTGEPFRPFDAGADYQQYVDGKPRYDGVRDFLASRDITLPEGEPSDPAGGDTVCAVGNLKNDLVLEKLRTGGIEVYDGAVTLLRWAHGSGLKTAVVSSSRNCEAVIEAAGIADLFDERVDGIVAAERGLPGKPAPDTFLEAARELGVPPERAVVFEDALVGVAAGRAGAFGLVVGVDRTGDADGLLSHGADIAVTDLATLMPA